MSQAQPQTLPDRADVVIIGGGVVGVSAAWHLARQGISVVLCEKGRIAGEQSSRNWGWIRMQGRDAREVPLMFESIALWRDIAAQTGAETGFTQAGCLYLATNEKEFAAHASWLETGREFKIDTRMLSRSELAPHLPGNADKFSGALYTPTDCKAEPASAVPAIARLAAEAGASFFTACAVRGIETTGGRVSAVITENGPVKTNRIICAAGGWTSKFCGSLGVRVPQLLARGSVFRTAPAPDVLAGTAWAKPVALRRRADGGYTVAHGNAVEHFLSAASFRYFGKFLPSLLADFGQIKVRADWSLLRSLFERRTWPLDAPSPFESVRVLDPAPSRSILAKARANLAAYFPQLADIPVLENWAGMIEASPDAIPILCEAEDVPGLFIATGFSGHGFGIGPGAGKAIADLATGKAPPVDMTAFRLQRFFDGSPLRIGPGV